MEEVYQYAIDKLNEEIEQLEISLTMNNYSKGQRQILELKLKGLHEKLERFNTITL